MSQVRDGDLEKLGILFERHHVRLFIFFLRMTGDRAASEDLVQEVFVRMLKYRKSFRERGEFSAWMFALARNVSADYFGRRFADVVAVVDRLPEVQRFLTQQIVFAASLAKLGRQAEATAAIAELRRQQPNHSIELAVSDWSLLASQRDLLIEGLRAAGLPPCATEDDLTGIAQPIRLPECQTGRAQRAATRS